MERKRWITRFKRSWSMFAVIALGPIFVLGLMLAVFVYGELEGIKSTYHITDEDIESPYTIFDKALLLNSVTQIDYQELQDQARRDTGRFWEDDFLKAENEKLAKKHSFVAVIIQDKFYYFGAPHYYDDVSLELLSMTNSFSPRDAQYSAKGKNHFLLKKLGVTFPNGQSGSICIVTDLNAELPHITIFTVGLILMVIIICILVIIGVIGYAYYNVIMPIQQLRGAVMRIRDGEYDEDIPVPEDTGFSELYVDFNSMRVALKDSIEERNKADALTKEVIGNISHDLKTPLTAIKGYAEGILDGVAATPERMNKYVRTIHSKAVDMAVLVDELSFFTKIYQKEEKFNFTEVNVNHYFSECVSDMALDLETREIQLLYQCYVTEDVLLVLDAEKIKRVIANIIGNAVKYIQHKHGVVVVSITEDEGQVTVMIRDNGKGIGEAELPHIFDRFYRTDSSRNSQTGGSGLGLAIAKKIVQEHGGKIWADSVLDKGTAVYFSLPKQEQKINTMDGGTA